MTTSVQWTHRFIDESLEITHNMTHIHRIFFSCIVKVFRIFVNLSNESQPFFSKTAIESSQLSHVLVVCVCFLYRHSRWLKYMSFDYMIAVRANPHSFHNNNGIRFFFFLSFFSLLFLSKWCKQIDTNSIFICNMSKKCQIGVCVGDKSENGALNFAWSMPFLYGLDLVVDQNYVFIVWNVADVIRQTRSRSMQY